MSATEAVEVASRYKAGEELKSIAADLGYTYHQCHHVMRQAGVRGRPKTTTEAQAVMLKAYEAGSTCTEAAALVGRNRRACERLAKQLGIARTQSDANRRYPLDQSFFDTINTDAKAYWLGFIAADGCVFENSLKIGLSAVDRSHLEKFAASLGTTSPITERLSGCNLPGCNRRRKSLQAIIRIRSDRIVNALHSHGIVPAKSLILRPWDGPGELMPAYWRGVLDGDGWWSCSKRGIWQLGLCGSRWVVRGFAQFARERLKRESTNIRKRGNIYAVELSGIRFLQATARLLYSGATVWLDRKKQIVDALLKVEPKIKSWKHLDAKALAMLRNEHGSWLKVGAAIGMTNPEDIYRLAHAQGLRPPAVNALKPIAAIDPDFPDQAVPAAAQLVHQPGPGVDDGIGAHALILSAASNMEAPP